MKRKIPAFIALLVLLSLPVSVLAQTAPVGDVRDALRKALFEYFDGGTSTLTVAELKDLLYVYISTPGNIVNLTETGSYSGLSMDVIYNKARLIVFTIPTCTDGTQYGLCSSGMPDYCFAGRIVKKCGVCGCPGGQLCSGSGNCTESSENYPFGFAGLYGYEDFAKVQELGARYSRPQISWNGTEVSDDSFVFTNIDNGYDILQSYDVETVISLRAKGWGTYCNITGISCPAYYDTCPHAYASCPPKDLTGSFGPYGYSELYYDFTYKVLKHMFDVDGTVGKVRPIEYVIVENEVNTLTFWHGTAEDYLKTRATVYKAVKDFNAAYGKDVKVVDNGIASGVWGNAIIRENFCSGDPARIAYALDFANRFLGRTYPGPITRQNLTDTIDCSTPSRDYLIMKEVFRNESAFGGPSFDYISYHFYEPWDTQEEVISYVKAQMLNNGYSKPVMHTEGGFADYLRAWNDTQLQQDVANDIVKNHVITFASGAKNWFWLELSERPVGDPQGSEYRGLYTSGYVELPAGASYRIMVEKINGFTNAEKVPLGSGIYAYRFIVNESRVYVLWSNAPATVNFSSQISGYVKITHVNGSSEIRSSSSLRITESPVFVEQSSFSQPRGIYVLDSKFGTCRNNNIRNYDFVDGYAWRLPWSDVETSEGVYDFSSVDCILSELSTHAPGKKLTVLLGMYGADCNFEPGYIASNAGQTWTYTDTNTRHECYNIPVTRAVPWDPYVQERFRLFLTALGNHISLRNDPRLGQITTYIPGLGHIREGDGVELSTMPGYSRSGFIAAIKNDLEATTDQFPDKFVEIGIWKVTDEQPPPALWEDVNAAILSEFDGTKNPRVGYFQENLAANKSATGVVTGFPSTDFAAPLYLSKDLTFITFQALTSWSDPFTGAEKVAGAMTSDGIEYGYGTYNAKYFEIYAPDADNATYQASLRSWGSCIRDDACCGIDCDDGDACTTDSCDGGTCSHTAIPDCGMPSKFQYVFVTQQLDNLTETQLEFVADRFAFVEILGSASRVKPTIDRLKSLNSGFKAIKYTHSIFTYSYTPTDEACYLHNMTSTYPNNRLKDVAGNAYGLDDCTDCMKSFFLTSVQNDMVHSLDGIMMDEMSVMGDRFLPSGSLPYSEENWQQCKRDFIDYIHENTGGKMVIFNGLYNHELEGYGLSDLVPVSDGGLHEGFITIVGVYNRFLNAVYWKQLMNLILNDFQGKPDKFFLANCKLKDPITTPNDRMFCFSSFLLIYDTNVAYSMKNVDLDEPQYYPEMDIDVGIPAETKTSVEGSLDSGVYARDYSKGKVIVNPSTSPVNYHLDKTYYLVVPSGGGVVQTDGTFGGSLSYEPVSEVAVPPQSGVVLLNEMP